MACATRGTKTAKQQVTTELCLNNIDSSRLVPKSTQKVFPTNHISLFLPIQGSPAKTASILMS